MASSPSHLTTGEASKILGFPQKTVQKLYDRGAFGGVRHPTSGSRLCSIKSLLEFARQRGMAEAVRQLQGRAARLGLATPFIPEVIVLSPDSDLGRALTQAGCAVQQYERSYAGFAILGQRLFDAAVLDCQLGTSDVEHMGSYLHRSLCPGTLLVCRCPEDLDGAGAARLWQAGFGELWRPPLDLAAEARKLRRRLTSPLAKPRMPAATSQDS